jgi:hypothetical protein
VPGAAAGRFGAPARCARVRVRFGGDVRVSWGMPTHWTLFDFPDDPS